MVLPSPETLLHALGSDWELSVGVSEAVALHHMPSQLPFVLVTGGEFTMGLTAKDRDLLELFLGSRRATRNWVDEIGQRSGPPTRVTVLPFLCAVKPLSFDQVALLDASAAQPEWGGVLRNEALALARSAGMRLLSEAEAEWLARQGSDSSFAFDCVREAPVDDADRVMVVNHPLRGCFGAGAFYEPEWAADDWFPNHEGRPETAIARTGGDPQGVKRFEVFDYEEIGNLAILNQLSARRVPGGSGRALVRLACDLPEAAKELLSELSIS